MIFVASPAHVSHICVRLLKEHLSVADVSVYLHNNVADVAALPTLDSLYQYTLLA